MAVGSARRTIHLVVAILGFGGLLSGASPAGAVEAFDGRLQAHGFVEMQVRGMSSKYGVHGDELDLAQWYNILNVEFELDLLPDGWGPIDLMSAFVRVEARYDCIYTHGCAMLPAIDTFGDDSDNLPRRLRDAEDPDYAGVIKVGEPVKRIQNKQPAAIGGPRATVTFGQPRFDEFPLGNPTGVLPPDYNTTPALHRRGWTYATGNHPGLPGNPPRCNPNPPYNCPGVAGGPIPDELNPIYHDRIVKRAGFPGFDTFFDLNGGDMIANTFDDPGIYLLGDFFDYKFALKDVRGPAGGQGTTQLIGPWLPKNVVHSRAVMFDKANPLRGRFTQSTYTSPVFDINTLPGYKDTPKANSNRRYYTRSTDLAGLGGSPEDTRLKGMLWNGSTPAEGYTDLVDPFPEELNEFWDQDGYFTAPKDFRIPDNQPSSNANQLFGGDYNGIIPCTKSARNRTPPNPADPDNRTLTQKQYDGTDKQAGCIPFTNVRVTGGSGELPLRPAPDRSSRFAEFDSMRAQGLYIPSPGLLSYMADGGDFDKHDFNIDETERAWNRGASQQDNKELKEAYVDMEFLDSRLWLRAGLQNIVWGKTELFRTTDQFNPIDIALSGPLAGLEESRIALWSARLVYSFYNVGPLDDVRFEFAANLDDFEPVDLGACGEPYTLNLVCGIPTGLWAHGLLGVGIAGVDRPDSFWDDSKGLEYGGRLEWRWDRFSFALTDYYGYNDFPYADAIHYYDRNVEYALLDAHGPNGPVFQEGAGRPLVSGKRTGCSGEYFWGGAGMAVWASANRDPDSYYSMTQAGIGRDPACLKPGGAAGELNQNGFTVARDDDGNVRFVLVHKDNGTLKPGAGTIFADDGVNVFPLEGVVPEYCDEPGEVVGDFRCEPMQYEVGLNEAGFNGSLFSEGWSPQNALENHSANQQSFAFICTATLTIGAALDPTACAFNLFGSPKYLDNLAAPIPLAEVMTCLLAGEIGGGCSNFLDIVSNNLQGIPPTREAGLVALNRDRNDGTITAQARAQDTVNALGIITSLGNGVVSRDTRLTLGNASNIQEVFFAVMKTLPGDEDMLTLDSTMTNEQRALLGCGPYFGTRCDTSLKSPTLRTTLGEFNLCKQLGTGCIEGGGIDFMNMEGSALMQSFVGIEGTDLSDPIYTDNEMHPNWAQWAAGGENFKDTRWAKTGVWLTTSGLPQPGTIEFAGGPTCTRYVEELNDTIVLPGCRGVNAVLHRPRPGSDVSEAVEFRFDDGYDPDVDGCVLGQSIDGHPVVGRYSDDSLVDLTPCFESTHKLGGFYVWPCKPGPGCVLPKPVPDLIDWDGKATNSLSPMSRPGSGTLWHPYAGCFANPARAVSGENCLIISGEDVDVIRAEAAGPPSPVQARAAALLTRLAFGKGGKYAGDFPGVVAPRNYEKAFFIPDEQLTIGSTVIDGFNIQSQIFRSEMAAFSHNFMTFLVQASCSKDEEDIVGNDECFNPQDQFAVGKCSYVTPQFCGNVKGFFGAAGVQRNVARAGGNEKYGRRDFLWHTGGELMLRYQRRNVLGFSLDFGEDYTKSSWGAEFTWVSKQNFFDSDDFGDNVSQSGVLNLTVSVDRPTFINFLNQNRTFFINSQWFFQYITDYQDGFVQSGPVNVLFTVAVFTGYFQDRLNPQLVTVYDFMSGSGGILPSVTYRFTDSLSVGIGMNFFFGKTQLSDMAVREFAPAGNRTGPHAYKNGVDQAISSFRDKDEIWLKLRWTF